MAKSLPSSTSFAAEGHLPSPDAGNRVQAVSYSSAGSAELREVVESSDSDSERSEVHRDHGRQVIQGSENRLHPSLEAATTTAQRAVIDSSASSDAISGGPFFPPRRDVPSMFGDGPYRSPTEMEL